MDRESLEKIRQMTKDKITVSNFQSSECMKENKNNNIYYIKRIAIAVCLCIILTSCVLFEKDVKAFVKYCFGIEGVDIAADNGYVEETNMNFIDTENELISQETGTIVNDVDVSVKIDEFVMDDLNLSMNFSFKFDDKIKEFLDLDNLQFIYLQDLMIFDEENRLLASECGKLDFEQRCKNYNLNYDFDEFILNENPRRSNSLNERNKEENLVKYGFNYQASDKCFPNSKELNFVFTKIKLEKYNDYNGEDINNGEYLKSKSVILTGDWKINIKVPEKMYNRPKNEYKAVSISHPDIEVDYAIASESSFKFNAILSNVKEVDFSNKPFEKEYEDLIEQRDSGIITEEECTKLVNELTNTEEYRIANKKWNRENDIITTDYIFFEEDEEKSIDKITHITNSKDKKFVASSASTFRMNVYDLNENKYKFTGTFDMTKNDATDELTVILVYYREPVEIKLEKIKE